MDTTLDYPYLLAIHVLCVDGQLHQNELLFIKSIAQARNVSAATEAVARKILSGEEALVSLDDVIESISKSEQEEALSLAVLASYFDGFIHPEEQELLESLRLRWNWSQSRYVALQDQAQESTQRLIEKRTVVENSAVSIMARLLRGVDMVLGEKRVDRIVASIGSSSLQDRVREYRLEALFAGPKYDEVIHRCQEIGQEDLGIVYPCYDGVDLTLKKLREELAGKVEQIREAASSEESRTAKAVLSEIESLDQHIDQMITRDLENLKKVHRKKQRAASYYSIAFLGRSKAGKSTLHAVLTGGGWEGIGAGRQNTTRINYVYEWKNLRIIDTPGIITPGDEELSKIAASVVDEADLICFVMTNDNQQVDEFRFFEELRKKGKPLVVVLNLKSDLSSEVRKRRFLAAPDRPFSDEKSNLGGHLDRIRRDAAQHYGSPDFPIIPVQLLAARMAVENPADPEADALMRASRFQNFIDTLRLSLIEEGILRRSQNMLGSSVPDLEDIRDELQASADTCAAAGEDRQKQAETSVRRLTQAADDHKQLLQMEIIGAFNGIRDGIPAFVEEHWKSSTRKLNANWKRLVEDYQIEKKSQNALTRATEGFNDDTRDLLDEISKELSLLSTVHLNSREIKNRTGVRILKEVTKWGSLITGSVATFFLGEAVLIVGIILIASSLLLGIVSMILPSKTKSKSTAVSKLTEELTKSLDNSEAETVKAILQSYELQCSDLTRRISDYFTESANVLSETSILLKNAEKKITGYIQLLNEHYAARILAFASQDTSSASKVEWLERIHSVEREVGDHVEIRLATSHSFPGDTQKVSAVIQEQISLQSEVN